MFSLSGAEAAAGSRKTFFNISSKQDGSETLVIANRL